MRTICAPKKPHEERFKDIWKWDPSNDSPCVQFHSQENSITEHVAPICYVHGAVEAQNKRNQTLEAYGSQEYYQTGAHVVINYQ